MPCYSPLRGFKSQETGGIVFKDGYDAKDKMAVACGQCLGCRLDRSRGWAMRIIHESSLYEFGNGNCFVTLTYRSAEECTRDQYNHGLHVPGDFSLHKSHVQKFLKRLRKAYPDQKIRFYMCGEYGSICSHGLDVDVFKHLECKTGRPHYHLCLFNFYPSDGVPIGPDLFNSPELDKLWKYGYTSYGDLTFESAAYVSRYVLKKINGAMAEDHYQRITDDGEIIFLEPEYSSMSRRPGIGKEWFDKYKDDCFPDGAIPVPGKGNIRTVPRFYDDLLEKCDPELYESVKRRRQKYAKENQNEFSTKRLETKYKVAKANQELFGSSKTL
jgi:hypothetical protein